MGMIGQVSWPGTHVRPVTVVVGWLRCWRSQIQLCPKFRLKSCSYKAHIITKQGFSLVRLHYWFWCRVTETTLTPQNKLYHQRASCCTRVLTNYITIECRWARSWECQIQTAGRFSIFNFHEVIVIISVLQNGSCNGYECQFVFCISNLGNNNKEHKFLFSFLKIELWGMGMSTSLSLLFRTLVITTTEDEEKRNDQNLLAENYWISFSEDNELHILRFTQIPAKWKPLHTACFTCSPLRGSFDPH